MAITTLNNRVSYAGDDGTTVFSFPNKFLLDADLVVIIRDALDVETVQTITTHYTVSGAGVDAGGNVTMITPPATGETLIIYRDPSPTQELDLRENDSAPAEAQETAYDKLTMLVQRLIDIDERTISLSDGFTDTFDLTLPSELTADTVIGVNAGGTALEMKTGDDLMSLAGALLIANDLSDLNSVSTALVNLGINLYDSRITTNASGVSTNVTDINALETTLSGGTGAVVWTTLAQTLSNKTFSDPIMAADGTSSLPSYTFSADLNTGMYRSTADTLELVGGGYAALQVKKSTGSFANIGMGGNASVSDSFPLLIERNIAAGMTIQAANPNGGASAASKIVLKAGIGSVDTGEIALWPTAQTLHAYQNRLVIRSSDSAAGISLVGSGSGADDVRIYNGGVASTNENIRFNADYSMQIMQEISTPASPSANTHKLYAKSDGKLYRLNSAGDEKELGAGSGSGVNFITNPDIESNTNDWNLYKDAAGAEPVDGTGGTSTLNLTRITTSGFVLSGTGSLNLGQVAGTDRQGEGASADIVIDNEYMLKTIIVRFTYATSLTFISGEFKAFVYDVDNATLLGPLSNDNDGEIINGGLDSGGVGIENSRNFLGTFTATDSLNYRIILHRPTTSTVGSELYLDTIKAGPDTFGPGYIGTNPQAYTPTFTGFGTVTGVEVSHWREGKFLKIRGRVTAGTLTAVEARVSFPNSLVSDPVALPNIQKVGMAGYSPSFARDLYTLGEPSVSYFTFSVQSGGAFNKLTGTSLGSPGEIFTFDAEIPIETWQASNLISTQEANYLTIKAKYITTAGQSITNAAPATNIVDYGTSDYDTHSSVTTGAAWKFTAARAGKFDVKIFNLFAATSTFAVGERLIGYIYKNGVQDTYIAFMFGSGATNNVAAIGSASVLLAKDDYIDIRLDQNSGGALSLSTNTGANHISITEDVDFKTFGVYKVDELVESQGQPFTFPAWAGPANWLDIVNFDLSFGTWQVEIIARHRTSSGVTPGAASDVYTHIHTVSGNNAGTLLYGENASVAPMPNAILQSMHHTFISEITVTDTTTYYLKQKCDVNPTASSLRLDYYKVIARRIK